MEAAAIKGIMALATAASASASLITAFKSQKDDKPSAAPVAEAPEAAPAPDDDATRRAKRRSIASQVARRGRASTILTQRSGVGGGAGDSLGGG